MNWAIVMVGFVLLVPVALLIHGAVHFRPRLARNVKYAESITDRVVQQHVALVSIGHPEYAKTYRWDHHPFYVTPAIGVWCYAACVFGGAPLTSNVVAMGHTARYAMATCFLVGSTLILIGALMGTRIGRWIFMPKVRDHLTSEVLGDDVSLPYSLAMVGLGATMVSALIYSSTSFKSTTGSLGGWLTGALALACIITAPLLNLLRKRFEGNDSRLITEALARLNGGDDDAGR